MSLPQSKEMLVESEDGDFEAERNKELPIIKVLVGNKG